MDDKEKEIRLIVPLVDREGSKEETYEDGP